MCGIDKDIAIGDLILEPDSEGKICQFWIDQGLVAHAHAITVAAKNPKNISDRHTDPENLLCPEHPKSEIGRGIQYSFIEPEEGGMAHAMACRRNRPVKNGDAGITGA